MNHAQLCQPWLEPKLCDFPPCASFVLASSAPIVIKLGIVKNDRYSRVNVAANISRDICRLCEGPATHVRGVGVSCFCTSVGVSPRLIPAASCCCHLALSFHNQKPLLISPFAPGAVAAVRFLSSYPGPLRAESHTCQTATRIPKQKLLPNSPAPTMKCTCRGT